eukprot:1148294-Pelagomonas_calceolata.AAC.2
MQLLEAAVTSTPAQLPHMPPSFAPIQGSSSGRSSIRPRPIHRIDGGLAALRPAPLEDDSVPQLDACFMGGELRGSADVREIVGGTTKR